MCSPPRTEGLFFLIPNHRGFIREDSCHFVACSKLTGSDESGSIGGKVILHDENGRSQVDNSWVWGSLYEPVELDTALVSLNQRYPHIGVPISQGTEFGHRFAVGRAHAATARDGLFELKDVPKGEYIPAAHKEGYTWRHVFDVSSQVEGGKLDFRALRPLTFELSCLHTLDHFPCFLSLASDEMMTHVGKLHFACVDAHR